MSWKSPILLILLCYLNAYADQNPKPPIGIATWPDIIDQRLGVSYERGQLACIRLYKNNAVDVIKLGKEKKPLAYRYRLLASNDTKLAAQFDEFVDVGIMGKTMRNIETEYRLLPRGWGLSPEIGGFGKNICIETGKWRVDKITKYRAIADPGSGLNIYEVDAEKTFQEFEWAKNLDKTLFGLSSALPKAVNDLLLIQGPKGYFVAPRTRSQLRLSLPKLPNAQTIKALIAGNNAFVQSYCEFVRSVKTRSSQGCTAIEYLRLVPNIRVFYVGIPKGNMIVFKYVDQSDPADPHLARGYLRVTRDNGFKPQVGTLYQ